MTRATPPRRAILLLLALAALGYGLVALAAALRPSCSPDTLGCGAYPLWTGGLAAGASLALLLLLLAPGGSKPRLLAAVTVATLAMMALGFVLYLFPHRPDPLPALLALSLAAAHASRPDAPAAPTLLSGAAWAAGIPALVWGLHAQAGESEHLTTFLLAAALALACAAAAWLLPRRSARAS